MKLCVIFLIRTCEEFKFCKSFFFTKTFLWSKNMFQNKTILILSFLFITLLLIPFQNCSNGVSFLKNGLNLKTNSNQDLNNDLGDGINLNDDDDDDDDDDCDVPDVSDDNDGDDDDDNNNNNVGDDDDDDNNNNDGDDNDDDDSSLKSCSERPTPIVQTPSDGKKYQCEVCHFSGKKGKSHIINIDINGVKAHVKDGNLDYLIKCILK